MKQVLLYKHLDISWFHLFIDRVHQVKADKMDFQETQLVSHLWMIMEMKIILLRSLDKSQSNQGGLIWDPLLSSVFLHLPGIDLLYFRDSGHKGNCCFHRMLCAIFINF